MAELEQTCGIRVELSQSSRDDEVIVDIARVSCEACGIDAKLGDYQGGPEEVGTYVAEDLGYFRANNCERLGSSLARTVSASEDAGLRSWSKGLFGHSMAVYGLAAIARNKGDDIGLSDTVEVIQNMISCVADEQEPDVYGGVRSYLEGLCPELLTKVAPGVYRKTDELWEVIDGFAPLLLAEGIERVSKDS